MSLKRALELLSTARSGDLLKLSDGEKTDYDAKVADQETYGLFLEEPILPTAKNHFQCSRVENFYQEIIINLL